MLLFSQRIDRFHHDVPFITRLGPLRRVEAIVARSSQLVFTLCFLFPTPRFERDTRWLMLALAVIASDGNTHELENPDRRPGLIADREEADALHHLQKHFGGQIFRRDPIRHAGSTIGKNPQGRSRR